jgi:hypothetical protein
MSGKSLYSTKSYARFIERFKNVEFDQVSWPSETDLAVGAPKNQEDSGCLFTEVRVSEMSPNVTIDTMSSKTLLQSEKHFVPTAMRFFDKIIAVHPTYAPYCLGAPGIAPDEKQAFQFILTRFISFNNTFTLSVQVEGEIVNLSALSRRDTVELYA